MARHCKAFRIGSALVVALWCCAWSGSARAYEDQASLDLAVGGALTAGAETLARGGPEVSAGGALGLSDLFFLRAQGGYLPLFGDGKAQQVGRVRLEAAYLLDVLRVVPFFGVGANLWLYRSKLDDAFEARPGAHILLGLDYLWSRSWSVGLDVRIGIILEPGNVASANEAQLRCSRMFDLF
ncbi:MAG: hypothetical protein QM778_04470 [Myxococcales bacterium]